eukprot:scaffold4332_cov143-Skeletonema_menzelii.AAC.5
MLIGSGTKLTFDQQRQYNQIMNSIDLQAEYTAASKYHTAYANYYQSKGWVSCDAHCQHYKSIMDRRKNEWEAIKAEGNARMSDAREWQTVCEEAIMVGRYVHGHAFDQQR